MNRQYYYIQFSNGKYRIFKEYIYHIQDDSIERSYNIEFFNGIIRKNYEVFEKRRKARQHRDLMSKVHKLNKGY